MKRPALVGILNVTPDSFSDGGMLGHKAFLHAQALAEAGADILDIGAESTRPGALPIAPDDEWARLEPVLASIHAQRWRQTVRLSIDTRHPETALRAIAHFGVDIINDVSGAADSAMLHALREHHCEIVLMHALSIPANPEMTLPADTDPIAAILAWKEAVLKRTDMHGVHAERIIFDPGIGFGKTKLQSLMLSLRAAELVASGGRWLFGHSRKSFLTLFTDAEAARRDDLTLAFSAQLAHAGVDYLRVHDVASHRRLLDDLCT
jgi:dihydropteroate synthase